MGALPTYSNTFPRHGHPCEVGRSLGILRHVLGLLSHSLVPIENSEFMGRIQLASMKGVISSEIGVFQVTRILRE